MSGRANTTAHSEWSSPPDKSFVATKAFKTEFYQYTASRAADLSMVGALVLHPSAIGNSCPAGRVVHANGKRLVPGVNPMTEFTTSDAAVAAGTTQAATVQAAKFMIGVYDPVSMLNGFIDPTSSTFAVYDKNRPASDYLVDLNTSGVTPLQAESFGGQVIIPVTPPADVTLINNPFGINNTVIGIGIGSARTGRIRFDPGTTALVNTIGVTGSSIFANSVILISLIAPPAAGTPPTTPAAFVTDIQAGLFTISTTASALPRSIHFAIFN